MTQKQQDAITLTTSNAFDAALENVIEFKRTRTEGCYSDRAQMDDYQRQAAIEKAANALVGRLVKAGLINIEIKKEDLHMGPYPVEDFESWSGPLDTVVREDYLIVRSTSLRPISSTPEASARHSRECAGVRYNEAKTRIKAPAAVAIPVNKVNLN